MSSNKNSPNNKIFAVVTIIFAAVVSLCVIVFFGPPRSSNISGGSPAGSAAVSEKTWYSEEHSVTENSDELYEEASAAEVSELHFRNRELLEQHYQKHGIEMGFSSAEEYEKAAAAVPENPDVLHKTEAEDGDDVYYIESTNEFVVVSTDGYLRTYFNPDKGIDYFNRQ